MNGRRRTEEKGKTQKGATVKEEGTMHNKDRRNKNKILNF
jgi:hypothetical protein